MPRGVQADYLMEYGAIRWIRYRGKTVPNMSLTTGKRKGEQKMAEKINSIIVQVATGSDDKTLTLSSS